jgi:thiamine-phosphate pyrophosphorylase
VKNLHDLLRLYAVTDRSWISRIPAGHHSLEQQVEEAILGGATIIQLREKELDDSAFTELATRIAGVTRRYGVPLIINDNLAVALACGADGLHIGQHDGNPRRIRSQLPAGMILGISAGTAEEARVARDAGADYIGAGAVFPTGSKDDATHIGLEGLREVCEAVELPVVAIGGITRDNAGQLAETGIAGIAVISAIFSDPEHTQEAANGMREAADAVCVMPIAELEGAE